MEVKEAATRGVSVNKGVLRNFEKFTGKPCARVFFTKPATLLKKRLWHMYFPVNFAKFLRTPFLQNTSDDCFCLLFYNSFFVSFNTSNFCTKILNGVFL